MTSTSHALLKQSTHTAESEGKQSYFATAVTHVSDPAGTKNGDRRAACNALSSFPDSTLLNPEMKLCELLALGHCIYLPIFLFFCASSGQSYTLVSPWRLIFVTSLTQRWLETLLRFEVFWIIIERPMLIAPGFQNVVFTLLRVSGKHLKSKFAMEVDHDLIRG